MKKELKISFSLLGLALFIVSGMINPAAPVSAVTPQTYATGLDILIFKGNRSVHSDLDGFTGNYTAAGNNVTVVSEYDFTTSGLTGYDVLLFDSKQVLTASNITEIVNWFNTDNKMLWVAGDDDFGGYFNATASSQNALLKALTSKLRLDAGGINDAESNDDGATYRVMANETGVSSTLTDAVTAGFTRMKFHGPTSVIWTNDDDASYKDLRNATLGVDLPNVDIVVNSSAFAYPKDQDSSFKALDFYRRSNTTASAPTGNYPMLVTDQSIGTNNMIVVSGEVSFSGYKRMYGIAAEYEVGTTSGSTVVDNLITYHMTTTNTFGTVNLVREFVYVTVVETETEVETETTVEVTVTTAAAPDAVTTTVVPAAETETVTEESTPISSLFVGLAMISMVMIVIVKRKR